MRFGAFLKQLRSERKMSLRDLSSRLNIDHAYLSRLENDALSPSDNVVRQISKLFKVSKEDLSLFAGKLPKDVARFVYEHPKEAVSVIREQFSVYNTVRRPSVSLSRNGTEQLRPIFETEHGRLYQCDCLDFLPSIESESIDCVFADPPFNLRKNYGQLVNDNLAEAKYLDWSYQWLGELVRVLKSGGSLFVYNLPKWNVLYGAFLAKSLVFRHWIAIDIKATLPIPGRLYPSHYSLLYFTKGKPRVFSRPRVPIPQCRHCGRDIKDYGGHRKYLNPEGLNVTDVWTDIPPVRHQKYKTRRANELSVKLLQRVLGISTEPGDLVLDSFGGAGTTFYAAEMMGREWVGCEIEDCAPIIHRLKGVSSPAKLSKIA